MADYVVSTSGDPIVNVNEARRHLNMSSTYDDAWLSDAVSAATRYVEDRTNRAYVAQTRRLAMRTFADSRYVQGDYYRRVYFPRGPLRSSSGVSVTYVNSQGTTSTMPTSDYVVSVHDKPSYLSEAYGATWPDTLNVDNDVQISYVAGASSVPPTVKHAVMMLVGHWYRNREAANDRTFSEVPYGVDALLGGEQVELYG